MKRKSVLAVALAGILAITTLSMTGCASPKKPTVALVVANNFGDKAFNDSAKAGAQRIEKDLQAKVTYIECGGKDYDAKLREAAAGADAVLAVGWQFENIGKIAEECPRAGFIWADGSVENGPENLQCITYAQNEGAFLAGYLAASVSQSGKVGMVGGEENAIIKDFLAGYRQGAAYAKPDGEVKNEYASGFQDTAAAKEKALSLTQQGCDVLFHAAGAAGAGVFEAAKEANFYAIGVDADQKHLDDAHIIASVVKDVGASLYDTVKNWIKDGKWESGTWKADLKGGYIKLGYGEQGMRQQVSDTLKEQLAQVAGKISSGEIIVDSALSAA